MNRMVYTHREYYTNIINDSLRDSSLPIDITSIAHACGLKVYTVKGWRFELSGMIKKSAEDGGDSGYAIYTNAKHPETNRRFTVAHEIAHFVLHSNLIDDGIVDDVLYRSNLSSYLETEANKFAADILMPIQMVREAITKKKFNLSEQAMAISPTPMVREAITKKKFDVSEQAMAINPIQMVKEAITKKKFNLSEQAMAINPIQMAEAIIEKILMTELAKKFNVSEQAMAMRLNDCSIEVVSHYETLKGQLAESLNDCSIKVVPHLS